MPRRPPRRAVGALLKNRMISVVVLTFNSRTVLAQTLQRASQVSDDVHVVDSFSSDGTCDLARSLGAGVVQHEFLNYGKQRNWAMTHLPLRHAWQLHLDADEALSVGLVEEMNRIQSAFPDHINGYFIARQLRFLGRTIRHGGMCPTWHMRLFRTGLGHCEEREYDQHFWVDGPSARLRGVIIDDISLNLSEWTVRHNRWADAEVREAFNPASKLISGAWGKDPVRQKRALRDVYNRLPRFYRAGALFIYRYFLRAGFLDGVEGLIFFVLQTFWFRFLVDAKMFEAARNQNPAGDVQ